MVVYIYIYRVLQSEVEMEAQEYRGMMYEQLHTR